MRAADHPAAAEKTSTRPAASGRSPRDYTPKHLADRILQSRSVLEGERKQVTVLFADVKGSMELSEQLDDEDWHRILDRFFEILSDGVHRFEGTVNQYTGDGIMALFGAPIAHEDHAQRACYAALHIRSEIDRYATELKREHGLIFSTRMGLQFGRRRGRKDRRRPAHGLHRAGSDRGPRAAHGSAGVTRHLLHDRRDRRADGRLLRAGSAGRFQREGCGRAVPVHRLVGVGTATSRFDISRARGLTRFVGRESDMAILDRALAQAKAGHGQVVGIVAEAGTGKSRLCFEFVERCRATGMTVNTGTGLAHGKNLPYLPMLQVFRGYYGIGEQDDDRTIREKIAGRMLLLDEGFRDVLPVLFEFFGAPDPEHPTPRMDPEAKQRALFSVLRRLVQGATPASAPRTSPR